MADFNAVVLWLHGAGEAPDAWFKRFKTGVDKIRMPWIDFAFPAAPTKNWFGAELPVIDSSFEHGGLDAAVAHVHMLLEEIEARGISPARIVLGGYGPGGALALLAGRTYARPIAGIACMGGWLLRPNKPSAAARPPILLCHGEEDDDIPLELCRFACTWLQSEGFDIECQTYRGLGHREAAEAPTVIAAPKNFITNRCGHISTHHCPFCISAPSLLSCHRRCMPLLLACHTCVLQAATNH